MSAAAQESSAPAWACEAVALCDSGELRFLLSLTPHEVVVFLEAKFYLGASILPREKDRSLRGFHADDP